MNSLWISLHVERGRSLDYILQTHFVRPIRTGTKHEDNYRWFSGSGNFTSSMYKAVSNLPTAISNLIKDASIACGVSPDTTQQQFITGEITLQISDGGVTVYKPYDKNRVQGEVSVPKQQTDQTARKETPTIKDTTQDECLLPAIEIKTQLYDAEALAGDQKCESFI